MDHKEINENIDSLPDKNEVIINFDYKSHHNYIPKNLFLTNFPNSIKNILKINQDNQGTFWNASNDRGQSFFRNKRFNEPFRCEEISSKELDLKKNYYTTRKTDEMYQFKKYIKIGATHIFHFQIRKNLLKDKQYLIYIKEYSLEIYDIIKNKRQSLLSMNGTFNDNIICFDVFQNDDKFLVFFGKDDGFVDVFTVKKNDFMQCLEMRDSNITPNFNKDLSITASEILLNDISFNRNDEENGDLFINYIKYIDQNKLITTSNDSHFKIIDIEKNVTEQKYKNDFPINHCDLNDNKNVLLCIGDSETINLVDLKSNKIINSLNEHFDYGIVIKFNPYNNIYFASGNQDFGCKIWDIRMLDKGSVSTSWGLCDNIGDLDWIDSDSLCYMENSFFSHIFNFKTNKIQDLSFFKIGNGIVHDKINNDIYLNTYKVNEDNPCGILCYETLKNKIYNSFNNINL